MKGIAMRRILGVAPLMASFSMVLAARAQSPALPGHFLGLLKNGQQVLIIEEPTGFRIVVGETIPAAAVLAAQQSAWHQAEAVRQVAQTQYEQAVTANRLVPKTVPEEQIQRLRLQFQQANLALEQARQKAARPVVWEVFAVGSDYVGVRQDDLRMFIPFGSIHVIVEDLPTQTAVRPKRPANQ